VNPLDHVQVASEECEAVARWAMAEQPVADLIEAYEAVKGLIGLMTDVRNDLEQKACAQLGYGDDGEAITVTVGGKQWRRSERATEVWTPEQKDELRRKVVSIIALKVATDEVTGEFNDATSKAVQAALREFDRFQTCDPSKFKTTALKPEGIDKKQFCVRNTTPALRGEAVE